MASVFVLKPIIDVLYEEVKSYKEELERLKKENSMLYAENRRLEGLMDEMDQMGGINDEEYACLATAPPTSSPSGGVLKQEEKQNKTENNSTTTQEETKNVKLIGGKDKKEYMKEYQRNYRKKQKDITLNL